MMTSSARAFFTAVILTGLLAGCSNSVGEAPDNSKQQAQTIDESRLPEISQSSGGKSDGLGLGGILDRIQYIVETYAFEPLSDLFEGVALEGGCSGVPFWQCYEQNNETGFFDFDELREFATWLSQLDMPNLRLYETVRNFVSEAQTISDREIEIWRSEKTRSSDESDDADQVGERVELSNQRSRHLIELFETAYPEPRTHLIEPSVLTCQSTSAGPVPPCSFVVDDISEKTTSNGQRYLEVKGDNGERKTSLETIYGALESIIDPPRYGPALSRNGIECEETQPERDAFTCRFF